jgi:hypothetical protein
MVIPVFGTRLPSSAISITLRLHWTREKRGMLFCATRSLILSKMLAERISVQLINEKAPTTLVYNCWVFCLCGCPTTQSRARIRKGFPFPSIISPLRSFSTSPGQNFSHQSRSHKGPISISAQLQLCSNRSTRWKRVTHCAMSFILFEPNFFFPPRQPQPASRAAAVRQLEADIMELAPRPSPKAVHSRRSDLGTGPEIPPLPPMEVQ